jgi:hypothetical protein
LPTWCQQTWQKANKLGRNPVEFVPNLADTPRPWQKKKNLAERAANLAEAQKIPPPHSDGALGGIFQS